MSKNAKYFSENILPYYFVFKTKGGDIVVKVDESDFAHLVGKQHTTNENIIRLNNGYFFQRALDGKITFDDLLNKSSTNENLSMKQKYISDKNHIFISTFDLLLSKVNLKRYSNNLNKLSSKFDCDYCHNEMFYDLEDKICRIDMLSIIGDTKRNLFYYNSIQKITKDSEINHFLRLRHIQVFEIKKISKIDIADYLKTNEKNIMKSPRVLNNQSNKKIQNKSFSQSVLKSVNSILMKSNLKIGIGSYGKGTIQVYKNRELIEPRAKLDDSLLSGTSKEIADYIKVKYSD